MKIEIRELKNGIPVLMEKIKEIDTVSLGIFVKTGAINELPTESGVSHYIEHMIFKGTKQHSAKELSEIIDNEGGNINAYTSKSNTVFYVQLLADKIKTGIDVLSEILMDSTFTQQNLSKERKVIIEEIKMYEDIPEETIHDENVRLVIDGNLGNSILGTPETLKKIKREDFLNYFNTMYKPSNMVISVAGNLDYDNIYDQLNSTLGKLKNKTKDRKTNEKLKINSKDNIIKKKTNQVHLCVNTRDVGATDKRKYAASIISNVLAGGMSSRLFQKIREDRGLAYSVYSYSTIFKEGGLFTVYAGTNKASYKEVVNVIKEEFADIKKNGITQKELERSKNQLLSGMVFALENSKNKMTRTARSYMIHGKIIGIKEIRKEISKITLEDIKKVAQYIFDEKYYSTTILGDI